MQNENLLKDDPAWATSVDPNQPEFTLFEAAMLWNEKSPAELGFFTDDLEARLYVAIDNEDPNQLERSIYLALIDSVKGKEFDRGDSKVIPVRKGLDDAIDGLNTKLSREQLIPWAAARGHRPKFLFPEDRASAPPPKATTPPAAGVMSAPAESYPQLRWRLREVKRADALRRELVKCLERAHKDGVREPPTATMILNEWRKNIPACVISISVDRVIWRDDSDRERDTDKGVINDRLGKLIERLGSLQ